MTAARGEGPALAVDLSSPVPAYEQIRAQVAGLVEAGLLPAGSRLPSVRALAADLGLAVGTVNRAYRELEAAGVVASRRRTGTVVATSRAPEGEVARAAQDLVRLGRTRGMSDARLLDIVRASLHAAGP